LAVRGAPARREPVEQRRRAAAEAIARFLDAVVPPAERRAPDLAGTPERVADAWLDDLLDGYAEDPAAVLAGAMPSRSRDLVAVTGIDFRSMCPHHLLPSRGVAHVAYVPAGRVVGFGQLVRLVDCFAHRLALEEDVARLVAEALVEHLGARGAACAIDAEQACLSVRGERQPRSRAHAQCLVGALEEDARLQRRFVALVEGAGARPTRARRR
jgi:GTP cyclohydrolase IA